MLLFITYSVDNNQVLHTSRQLHCRDVCKMSLWSFKHILNQNIVNFDQISNSMKYRWWDGRQDRGRTLSRRHTLGALSALLAHCEGNPSITRSAGLGVFFDASLNKLLNK